MEPINASTWSPGLRLDRTDRPDGATCLSVDGEIDISSDNHFRTTVMGLVGEPAVRILLLDVGGLMFIDSNGVTVLVKARRAAAERGISFSMINVREPIRGLLKILGVYEMLTQESVISPDRS
jgi:anti-sigma B factor antagonist